MIVPCKGIDDGLEENLSALLGQDYPEYEMIFVVDDPEDSAVSVIEDLSRKIADSLNTKMVVANRALACSQKAENLREAVLHASDKSTAFVFVDSDARPSPGWLRSLVAPLEDKSVGATTGYRWFISKRPTFASELRGMWNASIASALGPNEKSNFCWGGSMAIRRDTFEDLGIHERWATVVSDDFTITRAMNEAGLRIKFVPRALTASVENCTFRQLFEFTNRQMKITRVYAQRLWLVSFFGSGLFVGVIAAAFCIILFSRENSWAVFISLYALSIVALFSIGKSLLRLRAVDLVLRQYADRIDKQRYYQSVLWILTPPIFLFNCIAALVSRRIIWRGTSYYMHSFSRTSVLTGTDRDFSGHETGR